MQFSTLALIAASMVPALAQTGSDWVTYTKNLGGGTYITVTNYQGTSTALTGSQWTTETVVVSSNGVVAYTKINTYEVTADAAAETTSEAAETTTSEAAAETTTSEAAVETTSTAAETTEAAAESSSAAAETSTEATVETYSGAAAKFGLSLGALAVAAALI